MWNLSEVRQSRGSVPFTRGSSPSASFHRACQPAIDANSNLASISIVSTSLSISSELRDAVEPCLGIWAEDARKTWIQARGLMLKCVACPWYKSLFTGTLRSVYAACFRSGCFPRGREKRGRFFSFLPPSYPAPSFRSCFSSFLITFPFEMFPRNVSLLRALNP